MIWYYSVFQKWVLGANSYGPYLDSYAGSSLQMTFTEPFAIQYSYGDRSNPELDIILITVELGSSMIMLNKEFYVADNG